MTKGGVQGTEYVDALDDLDDLAELKAEKKKRKGLKPVGPAYCEANTGVSVTLRASASEALSRAAYYLKSLPQRVAEVEAAAEAVYEAGRRANK